MKGKGRYICIKPILGKSSKCEDLGSQSLEINVDFL
jgi:hypothetical protein